MVINYDIPWNPVRVIQRVGRINRISKKVFENLFIVNFFPTEKGATIVKSREIAEQKMFLIHNTLGEDSKIFDVDEEPTASGLFDRIQENPDNIETESFYTKALRDYLKIKKQYPELIEEIEYDKSGNVKIHRQYVYQDSLLVKEITLNSKGKTEKTIEYIYNEEGLETGRKYYDNRGRIYRARKFSYKKEG